MQLQGELAKDGGVRVYKNVFDVLAKTWKNEGIKGMQRGLGSRRPYPHPSERIYACDSRAFVDP